MLQPTALKLFPLIVEFSGHTSLGTMISYSLY